MYKRQAIVTNIYGNSDAVIDRKTGIFVGIKDHNKMLFAMEFLVTNPEQSISLGRSAREFVEKHYRSEIVCQNYAQYLHKLLCI